MPRTTGTSSSDRPHVGRSSTRTSIPPSGRRTAIAYDESPRIITPSNTAWPPSLVLSSPSVAGPTAYVAAASLERSGRSSLAPMNTEDLGDPARHRQHRRVRGVELDHRRAPVG